MHAQVSLHCKGKKITFYPKDTQYYEELDWPDSTFSVAASILRCVSRVQSTTRVRTFMVVLPRSICTCYLRWGNASLYGVLHCSRSRISRKSLLEASPCIIADRLRSRYLASAYQGDWQNLFPDWCIIT